MQGQLSLPTLLLLASWSSGAGLPPTQRGQPGALWFLQALLCSASGPVCWRAWHFTVFWSTLRAVECGLVPPRLSGLLAQVLWVFL